MNNIAMLIGNLTRDPETKQLDIGGTQVTVCQFSIAVNRRRPDADGNRVADYFNVTAWRGLGDLAAKYLRKGRKCQVVGMIKTRTYEKDGVKRKDFEIEATDIEFLSPPQHDGEEDAPSYSASATQATTQATPPPAPPTPNTQPTQVDMDFNDLPF